jgi:hypothetical protein
MQYNKNYKNLSQPQGFIALILVIMVTAIILVSNVIISMVNTSNNLANYHMAESEEVSYNIDACLDDAYWRITSSTSVSGTFGITSGGVDCGYEISATASGLKIVTSTATTTSALGNWHRQVIAQVNVSTTPITISYYKDGINIMHVNTSEGSNSPTVASTEILTFPWGNPNNILSNGTGESDNSACGSVICSDYEIKLIKADSTYSSQNKALATPLGLVANPGYTSYGGSGQLWGETWSYTDINSDNFGLVLKYRGDNDTDYLKATDFNFNIPNGAVVTGILAEVEPWVEWLVDEYRVHIDHVRLTIYYRI